MYGALYLVFATKIALMYGFCSSESENFVYKCSFKDHIEKQFFPTDRSLLSQILWSIFK